MSLSDPIADMLTRIRNAIAVNKSEVSLPYSKSKEAVARILKKTGYIHEVSTKKDGYVPAINIIINKSGTNPTITEISRISKPGRRLYAKASEMPRVKNGRGVVVVSTSQGLMTGVEAAKNRIGGELICKVY